MLKQKEAELGRNITDQEIEPVTQQLMAMADSYNAQDYARASQVNHAMGRVVGRFHEDYDVILAPTLSSSPAPIGFFDKDPVTAISEFMADTPLANQVGTPSISLPLAWSETNLPLGMMFSAAMGNEAILLRLAAQLEDAAPWRDRMPPVHASQS